MKTGSLCDLDDKLIEDGPLVSIIVPVYNTPEGVLRRCLRSLLVQDYRDIELVVVDDGSNLDCVAVLEDVLASEPRARIIAGGHKGVSHARNVGIDAACGEWLAFVDADDEVEPYFVSHALKVALAEGADLVCGSVDRPYQDFVLDRTKFSQEYFVVRETRDLASAATQMLGHAKYKYFAGPDFNGRAPHAKLFSKEGLGALRYNEHLTKGEDTLFNYQFIKRCRTLVIADDLWYLYYQYEGSAVRSTDLASWKRSIEETLASRGDGDPCAPFVSRCAYMCVLAVESLARSVSLREACDKGAELLTFAGGLGCFSKDCYDDFVLSPWLSIYIWLCKRGHYRLACGFWSAKTIIKDRLTGAKLIDPKSVPVVQGSADVSI